MSDLSPFELKCDDGKLIRGDYVAGEERQVLFVTGFLSKRWGNKSRALAQWCRERNWGFACYDVRGFGDSEGSFQEYTLYDWMDDVRTVVRMLEPGPPLTLVGSSLGGWLAWLMGQEREVVKELLLIAPAFNMFGVRAQQISLERRRIWKQTGWMPYDDDALHRDYPLSWRWVEESEALWTRRLFPPRPIKTTILHGLQDMVIRPEVSWNFVQHVVGQDPEFPIELVLKTGDHRLSSPQHLDLLKKLFLGEL